MSEFNKNIKQTFANLLSIYQDVATLFKDADALLEEADNLCFHGSGIIAESSKSLAYPEWWVYKYMLRGYASEAIPLEIKAIGVFFLDSRHKPIDPLLLFGKCVLVDSSLEQSRDSVVFIRDAWFKSDEDKALNQCYKLEGMQGIESGYVKGLALETLKDLRTLKEQVVEPLLNS